MYPVVSGVCVYMKTVRIISGVSDFLDVCVGCMSPAFRICIGVHVARSGTVVDDVHILPWWRINVQGRQRRSVVTQLVQYSSTRESRPEASELGLSQLLRSIFEAVESRVLVKEVYAGHLG